MSPSPPPALPPSSEPAGASPDRDDGSESDILDSDDERLAAERNEIQAHRARRRAKARAGQNKKSSRDSDGSGDSEDDDAGGGQHSKERGSLGFMLLRNLGWKEGTGCGKHSNGPQKSLDVTGHAGRAGSGIGAHSLASARALNVVDSTAAGARPLSLAERVACETSAETAAREARVASSDEAKRDVLQSIAAFKCDICDKQYRCVMDYENHLSSYDHLHTRRRKELRAVSKSYTASSSSSSSSKVRKQTNSHLGADKELEKLISTSTAAAAAASNLPVTSTHILGGTPAVSRHPIAASAASMAFRKPQLPQQQLVTQKKPVAAISFSKSITTKRAFGDDDYDDEEGG